MNWQMCKVKTRLSSEAKYKYLNFKAQNASLTLTYPKLKSIKIPPFTPDIN